MALVSATADESVRDSETRRIALHVNFDDAERMNYTLNNAENLFEYYGRQGTAVEIRIIAHGPGLHMLRADTSPVQERIASMTARLDGLSLFACSNTRARMAKAEGRTPEIIDQATLVPSGVVELVELQRAGWAYLKP